ncbi:hypothetical protein LOK49_LG06G02310 [Camellia lanceoleosa]|uniref:Uncharacterized protein n=1 Tax=Camellia lanceoleosa TaxID=1840588 RepID=A0ACC0HA04_9ERIC|nr:hypothetical protein LOK49_LG06G02310 [Camellia lanceoleosa]
MMMMLMMNSEENQLSRRGIHQHRLLVFPNALDRYTDPSKIIDQRGRRERKGGFVQGFDPKLSGIPIQTPGRSAWLRHRQWQIHSVQSPDFQLQVLSHGHSPPHLLLCLCK